MTKWGSNMARDLQPPEVTGYSKSIEHERGANAAPLGAPLGSAKAASYRKPDVYPPPHSNQNLDTGSFGGDKPMKIRSAKVQP